MKNLKHTNCPMINSWACSASSIDLLLYHIFKKAIKLSN